MTSQFRAVVIGLPYFAKALARLMNRESKRWRFTAYDDGGRFGTLRALFALQRADVLVSFGGPGPDAALTEVARKNNVPVLVIWAGSDVIKAKANPLELQVVRHEHFYNVAVAKWLVDELAQLGIEAECEGVSAVDLGAEPRPLPSQFRVLVYLPLTRREFYGAEMVYEIARAMPDVPFTVVGAGPPDSGAPGNMTFTGYVNDMRRRIEESTVLLRVPKHDGKSMLVLEALALSRYVVWNYEFPHVFTARTRNEALDALRELRRRHDAGELTPNEDGRAFIKQHFSPPDIAARFEDRLDAVIREKRSAEQNSKWRVAISGLDLFCAEACANTRLYAKEWAPNFLRTSSRLEVLASILALFNCDVWYSIGSPVADRWLHMAGRILRKPRILHWVGSDIKSLSEHPEYRRSLNRGNIKHLAEIEWTASELRELAFTPKIAPLPPRHLGTTTSLPEAFTVLLYLPETRGEFYGRASYEELMARLSRERIRYLVVGGGRVTAPDGVDVEHLGWRFDLSDVYRRSTLLIRNTSHDGLSLMVLEALSYGRHVLWTQKFPFCRRIVSTDDMERETRELLSAFECGTLGPLAAASELIRRDYDPGACIRRIAETWDLALQTAR